MPVTSSTRTASLAANGVSTSFSLGFGFDHPADLEVDLVASGGERTALAYPANFNGVPHDSNGTLTTSTAYASGYSLEVRRVTKPTQGRTLNSLGKFDVVAVVAALDKLTFSRQDETATWDAALEDAETAATAAASSQAAAAGSASAASTSASNAAISASAAGASASNATTSATAAAGSASDATDSATAAAASEAAVAEVAEDAALAAAALEDTQAAAAAAEASATAAAGHASTAEAAAATVGDVAADAAAAADSATAAAGSATAAASSASGAATSASNAAGSATTAAGHATNAETAKDAAEAAQAAAEAAAASAETGVENDSITNAMLKHRAAGVVLGRVTSGTGAVEDLTAGQVRGLLNVADGSTANDTDANLRARSSHTGTQPASTISDFDSAVSGNGTVAGALQRAGGTMTGLLNVAGVKVASGAVSGALTSAAHSGGVFTTSGNVTCPNEAGFSITLIGGGAHDVNVGTGAAVSLAAGDLLSIAIPAAGTVRAVHTEAADVLTMAVS